MVRYKLFYTKIALKDAKKIKQAGLLNNIQKLLNILQNDPYQTPPSYEKLVGDLCGAYSRRINIKHRLVYQILESSKAIKVLRFWSHYD